MKTVGSERERLVRATFFAATTLYIVLHFVRLFTPAWRSLTDPVEAAIAFVAFIAAFLVSPPDARAFALVVVPAALGLFFWRGFTLDGAMGALLTMEALLPVVLVVPLLGNAFAVRGYAEAVVTVVGRVRTRPLLLYGAIALFSQLIGATVALSGIVIVYALLAELARDRSEGSVRFLAGSVLRGYHGSYYWSPNAAPFAIAVSLLGAPLALTVFEGSLLALAALAIALLLEHRFGSGKGVAWLDATPAERAGAPVAAAGGEGAERRPGVGEFLVLFALLIATVVALDHWTAIDLLDLVPLVTLAFTFLILAAASKAQGMARVGEACGRIARGWRRELPLHAKEVTVLLATGVMVGALTQTDAGVNAFASLQRILPETSWAWIGGLQLLILLLGCVGLTPIPATLVVASTIDVSALPLPPDLLSLAIVGGAAVAILITPISVPLIILSGRCGRSTFEVGTRWNLVYALLVLLANITLLQGFAWLRTIL